MRADQEEQKETPMFEKMDKIFMGNTQVDFVTRAFLRKYISYAKK